MRGRRLGSTGALRRAAAGCLVTAGLLAVRGLNELGNGGD